MPAPATKLRGRQKRINLEYSVCAALAVIFFVLLALVISLFTSGADANTQTLDELAGISSSERAQKGAEALNSQSATAAGSSAASGEGAGAAASGDSAAAGEAGTASAGGSSADSGAIGRFGTSESSVITTGRFATLGQRHTLSYEWQNAPDLTLPIYDEEGMRVFPFVPDAAEVRAGEQFTVDANYPAGYTVYVMEGARATGKYVFSGWSMAGQTLMPDVDLTITGSWEYSAIDAPTHKVSYSWSGILPATQTAEYVDAQGNVIAAEVPAAQDVAEGETFAIDSTWAAGTKIYFKDLNTGTLQREYTFSGWQIEGQAAGEGGTGEGGAGESTEDGQTAGTSGADAQGSESAQTSAEYTMGTQDMKFTGTWTSTFIKHTISYDWFMADTEPHPASGITLYKNYGTEDVATIQTTLPEQASELPAATVMVSNAFEIDTQYAELNEDGTVKCYWVFHGWSSDDVQLYTNVSGNLVFDVGNTDITIYAEWSRHDANEGGTGSGGVGGGGAGGSGVDGGATNNEEVQGA